MEQIQAVPYVDRYVHDRQFTDRRLVNWALYFFLLSWVTYGIYVVYIWYARWSRADRFRDRRLHYCYAVIAATSQYAEMSGQYDAVRDDLYDLQHSVKARFADVHKPVQGGLATVLSFLTLGIYGFYAIYRTMDFWWEIQLTERYFDEKLSRIWRKLGIVDRPMTFVVDEELNRNFWLYLFLTIVTAGLFGIVWDYRMHTDPDRLFPRFHAVEDAVLGALHSLTPHPEPHS